jgi:cytochrome c oxidase assembly protein subunit 11
MHPADEGSAVEPPRGSTAPGAPPHRRLVVRLLIIVAAAFGFGFALVPLYDVLCQATGLNGKTAGGFRAGGLPTASTTPAPSRVDLSRLVTVEFTGTVMPGLPWDMRPLKNSVDLHPGELQTATYLVRNNSSRPITGQAVPSVTPGQAAARFEKIECFCFTQQTLAPGEARELPVAFIVRPELDADIRTITLSYSFYNVEPTARSDRQEARP